MKSTPLLIILVVGILTLSYLLSLSSSQPQSDVLKACKVKISTYVDKEEVTTYQDLNIPCYDVQDCITAMKEKGASDYDTLLASVRCE